MRPAAVNHVTMRHERRPDSGLLPVSQPSVDAGMSLERLLTVTQHAPSVDATDLFQSWLSVLPSRWRTGQRLVDGPSWPGFAAHFDGVRWVDGRQA